MEERVNDYRGVKLWFGEECCFPEEKEFIIFQVKPGEIRWENNFIGIEAKFNPRHLSNYGMIFMKYTYEKKNVTDVKICIHKENQWNTEIVKGNIVGGLNQEFAEYIKQYFIENSIRIPPGKFEILYGSYDVIGSSQSSFYKTLNLLMFAFNNQKKLNVDLLYDNLSKIDNGEILF